GVQHHVPARDVMPGAGGCDGGADGVACPIRGSAGADRDALSTGNAAALWDPRMAGDAAAAGRRRAEQRVSSVYALNPGCHGPQKRATQEGIELISGADAPLLGGPVKPGHDTLLFEGELSPEQPEVDGFAHLEIADRRGMNSVAAIVRGLEQIGIVLA